jgi:hypothetical protein
MAQNIVVLGYKSTYFSNKIHNGKKQVDDPAMYLSLYGGSNI